MPAVHQITIETFQIESIPLMVCLPVSAEQCPFIFYIPGYTASKKDGLSLGIQLAQRGIGCVAFDPLYHGERYDARLTTISNGIYPPESGLDMFMQFLQVIRQSAQDIQTLLKRLPYDSRFDTGRIGVTGHSMGAYASFLAFADIPAIRCAVPMMGIPTFTRRWTDLLDECAFSNPDWEAALAKLETETAQHTALIRTFDPAEKLLQAAPRALLAMNGDFDSDQPKHYTLDWYRAMREVYAPYPGHLKWNIYPVGHTVTPQMEQDAVEWFVRYL